MLNCQDHTLNAKEYGDFEIATNERKFDQKQSNVSKNDRYVNETLHAKARPGNTTLIRHTRPLDIP